MLERQQQMRAAVRLAPGSGSDRPIVLKNSNGGCPQAKSENVDLLERPRSDDRHSVDGRRPPKNSLEQVAAEFFNTIGGGFNGSTQHLLI